MPKANKKAINLKIEMSSLKEKILQAITHHTAVNVKKLRYLSTADLMQTLSVILSYEKHEHALLVAANDIEFIDEYLSKDMIRQLNGKNIYKNKSRSRFGSTSKDVHLMMKINAYFMANKALSFSFSPTSQKALLNVFNDKMLRQPEVERDHQPGGASH